MSPGSICKLVSLPVVPNNSCRRVTCSASRILNSYRTPLARGFSNISPRMPQRANHRSITFARKLADAAAGKQLLCQLHRMGLLGLQHKAAGIKVFGKAGNAIGGCTHTAFLGGAALRDFLPRTGCKTHSISSVFSARHPGAAPRARSPERCSIPQACVRM